ncbi:MAG TPA: hypothetical protein VF077_02960 [Nitrospiraceae bacterium]
MEPVDFDTILKMYVEHSLNYADLANSLRQYAEKKYAAWDEMERLADLIEKTLTKKELQQPGADDLFPGLVFVLHGLNGLDGADKHKKIIAKLLEKV